MSERGQKVAIITGGSQGIGASLVTAYRRQGWSVVATARTIRRFKVRAPGAPSLTSDFISSSMWLDNRVAGWVHESPRNARPIRSAASS